ncbi:NAD(P)/FAD-dependent oxidoreductase [Roseibacillus persicicus]|uniref:NAD(P)/FAD-dependent oxidoreductase n=1 Tax=Roseibacillus persicicus TaxID=454148 RepID=UPI00280F818C|nr:NAD(P)/FAD-dependent oxidoreductase [Roseibacillus persicicus]MDQ8189698.1 NAD(P)/FAD-dependent oxidoreductase [Roseibacillus persicicus]
MSKDHHQLIVIGGGAAGFFGAIAAAEQGVERVLILEKSKEVLTKVRISGGGRCNVTHDCLDPRELVKSYPRGHRSLHGPFHRFHAADTIAWFEDHGVTLKTEADGRMFPSSNTSETIVNCLTNAARQGGVEVRTRCKVTGLKVLAEGGYEILLDDGASLTTRHVLIATGGLRGAEARETVRDAGHEFSTPVPSLFTFHIDDARLADLQGVSVPSATVSAMGQKMVGPVLITHWGLSGPGILRLSAWAAREFAECRYHFTLLVNWTGSLRSDEVETILAKERKANSTRSIRKRSLIEGITIRFWGRLCEAAGIEDGQTWANLTKQQTQNLINQLCAAKFQVTGKSTNKDEFVTCGGVHLKDLNLKTMESKAHPGLHFAGEVLDIDGITGGFNFQAAWTTGYLAGSAIAESEQAHPCP